ncbi:MAG: DUF3107 domain-containing protein [Streptosporangiaceae bacterium]
MEVKIGIHSVPRELVVETDTSAEEVERSLSAALEKGEHAVFALSVAKGGRVLVPAGKIAYVEFGGAEARRVGFGNIGLGPVAASLLCLFAVSGGPGGGPGPVAGIVNND